MKIAAFIGNRKLKSDKKAKIKRISEQQCN
jgi:hypothetical protein